MRAVPIRLFVEILLVSTLTIMSAGCATVYHEALPAQRSKAAIQKTLEQPPDRIVTSAQKLLKYNADEEWIFELKSSLKVHYYFRNNELIAIDTYASAFL